MKSADKDLPRHPSIERAAKLAKLLDAQFGIPLTPIRVGLDPVMDLLPVPASGALITTLLSCYVFWVAYELGFPKRVYLHMAVNILVDALISLIPFVAPIADTFWKANLRNIEILDEAHRTYGVRQNLATPSSAVIDVQAE